MEYKKMDKVIYKDSRYCIIAGTHTDPYIFPVTNSPKTVKQDHYFVLELREEKDGMENYTGGFEVHKDEIKQRYPDE